MLQTSSMNMSSFDQAQILPCYIIHLDLGRHIAKYLEHIPVNSRDWIEEC